MADHSHFPTFRKVVDFSESLRTGQTAHWLVRRVFTERGLLRTGLYSVLLLCVLHIVITRFVVFMNGMSFSPMFGRPFFGGGNGDSSGQFGHLANFLSFLLGPLLGEFAPMLAVFCMIGLVLSIHPPVEAVPPVAKLPLRSIRREEPITPPKPPAPERHPLDPSPDDEPLPNPWPARSHPKN